MRRWLYVGVLMVVLPFTLVACGDDDDDDGGLQDAANDAATTIRDKAEDAQSAVAGIAPVTVDLDEQGGSGVSGDAIVTPEGSDTSRVTFNVDVDFDGDKKFEAGIWEGSCDTVTGTPKFGLDELDEGNSTSQVDQGIQELKDGNYVIALRDGGKVVACGALS
ncbi:MAG: hypothetical protein ACM3S1_15315 [Hyphomicrobiales bacterium]